MSFTYNNLQVLALISLTWFFAPSVFSQNTPQTNSESTIESGSVSRTSHDVAEYGSSRSNLQSTKLYGRIEEISGNKGAQFPIQLHSQSPKIDNSKNLEASATARTTLFKVIQSFPFDWLGNWGGTLKVYTEEFSSLSWQNDAEETKKEQELLHPNASGAVTFEFTGSSRRVYLQPARVIFSVPMSSTRYSGTIANMFGGMAADDQSKAALNNMLGSIPVLYALHLGDVKNGIGVSGNTLQNRVIKNEVRELSSGVLEQQVVSYDADRHVSTGKVTYSYSESVLRFYKRSPNYLSVQVAVVNYLPDGRFLNKVILSGDVVRGQQMPSANIENPMHNGIQTYP